MVKLNALFIFLGGGLGSLCRYYLTFWIDHKTSLNFPLGTFTSNVLACFILGLISAYILKHQIESSLSLFLVAGFCGGFSTFSSFSKENYQLLSNGDYLPLFLNITISIIIGIAAFFGGLFIFKSLFTN